MSSNAAAKRYTRNDLNEKQAAWLDTYIELGQTTAASIEAVVRVYGYDENAARSYAHRMVRHPKIVSVLAQEDDLRVQTAAGAVQRVLTEMAVDGIDGDGRIVKHSERIKAAKIVLDRGRGAVAQRVIHEHQNLDASFEDLFKQFSDNADNMPLEDRRAFATFLRSLADKVDPPMDLAVKVSMAPEKPLLLSEQPHPGTAKRKDLFVAKRRLPGQDYTKEDALRAKIKKDKLEKRFKDLNHPKHPGKWNDVEY